MTPPAAAFLEVMAGRAAAGRPDDFITDFAAATKTFGKAPFILLPEEVTKLVTAGFDWTPSRWSLDDAARVALLVRATEPLAAGEAVNLTEEAFRQGDNREKAAILRALPLLARPADYLAVAIEACRSSVQPIFEAIACHNPYPASHFPEAAFNQMVIKALFTEVSLAQILGLKTRLNAELARMTNDYAQERRAAGRTLSADLTQLISELKEPT